MRSRLDALERARRRVDVAVESYSTQPEGSGGDIRLESVVDALCAYDVAAAVAVREAPSQQERARMLAVREAAA